MAKTLVIRNADFSAVALDHVDFNVIECENITINKSTMSFTAIGETQTITATITPSNATEPVVWSTTNGNVATVVGGVVTAVGIGAATITATCGAHSASCTVSVIAEMSMLFAAQIRAGKASSGDKIYAKTDGVGSADYGLAYTTTPSAGGGMMRNSATSSIGATAYPIMLPKGCTEMEISNVPSGFKVSAAWCNSASKDYDNAAELVGYIDPWNSGVPTGNHTDAKPDSADSFFVNFYCKTSIADASAIEGVRIVCK